jgi:hypothetical protein
MFVSLGLSYAAWLLAARSRILSFLFNGITRPAPLHRARTLPDA